MQAKPGAFSLFWTANTNSAECPTARLATFSWPVELEKCISFFVGLVSKKPPESSTNQVKCQHNLTTINTQKTEVLVCFAPENFDSTVVQRNVRNVGATYD